MVNFAKFLKHDPRGASNAKRWMNCHGFVQKFDVEQPPRSSNIWAAEGTVAHSVAADLLKQKLGLEKYALNCVPGVSKREADGFTIEITDEMIEAVNVYLDLIDELTAQYMLKPHQILIEQKVEIPIQGFNPIFGTADLVINIPYVKLIVIDYKHGVGTVVPAENNEQLLYYALGAFLELPKNVQADVEIVSMAIVQPRAPGAAETNNGIEWWTVGIETLLDFHEALNTAYVQSIAPDASLIGGPWCKYCPVIKTCDENLKYISEQAGIDFAVLPLEYQSPSIANLKPDQIANILNHAGDIKNWLEALHTHAFGLAERGTEIPGWHLTSKIGNRQYASKDTEESLVKEIGHLVDVYEERTLKSPKQLEDEIKRRKKQAKDSGLTEIERLLKSVAVDKWTIRPNNGKTLVRTETAKGRQKARLSLETDFADLDVQELTSESD